MTMNRRTSLDQINSIITTVAVTALHAAHTANTTNDENGASATLESARSLVALVRDVLVGSVKLLVVGFMLLVSSLLSYLMFYYIIMPTILIQEPLYFDYSCVCGANYRLGSGRNDGSCLLTNDHRTNQIPSVCSPMAQIDFLEEHTQWFPLSLDVAPVRSESRLLQPGSRYYIDISLVLPESEVNKNLGVFMVQSDLYADNGSKLATSFRPSILPYQGKLVGIVRKLFLLVPLLLGAIPEARHIELSIFDNYVESLDQTLALTGMSVKLIVNTRSQFPQTAETIQVISGEVRIGKELNRLQSYMKNWFYSCLVFGTFSLMLLKSTTLYFVYVRIYDQGQSESEQDQVESNIDSENENVTLNTNDHGVYNSSYSRVDFGDDNPDDWTTNIDDCTDSDENGKESEDNDVDNETGGETLSQEGPKEVRRSTDISSSNNENIHKNMKGRHHRSQSNDSTQRLIKNVMKGRFEKFTIFTGKAIFVNSYYLSHSHLSSCL